MAKLPAPSDVADKFMLRLPDGMRERVAAAAKENNRSMNAEIVSILSLHYPPPPSIEALQERIENTKKLMGEYQYDKKFISDAEKILMELTMLLVDAHRREWKQQDSIKEGRNT